MKTSELLSSLKNDLQAIVAENKSVCLWLSGGADSTLLLKVLLERRLNFAILVFPDGWTGEQKRIVNDLTLEHNLQIFSYPAISHLIVRRGQKLALVSEYAINSRFLPIVRDIVPGARCAFDIKLAAFARLPPIRFDAHIFGSRRADRHFIFGKKPVLREKSFRIGSARIFAPLFNWKKNQVRATLRSFGVLSEKPKDALDTGNIATCTNCLTEDAPFCPKTGTVIEKVEGFDGKENLKIVRAKLGLE